MAAAIEAQTDGAAGFPAACGGLPVAFGGER